jgi:hypothetical protein
MAEENKSELISRRMALFLGITVASAVAVPATVLIASDDAEAQTAGMTRRHERRAGRKTRRAERRKGPTPAAPAAPAAPPAPK